MPYDLKINNSPLFHDKDLFIVIMMMTIQLVKYNYEYYFTEINFDKIDEDDVDGPKINFQAKIKSGDSNREVQGTVYITKLIQEGPDSGDVVSLNY